jgi:succinate dehydrogenase / fumarate reductase cytochrome b subunit
MNAFSQLLGSSLGKKYLMAISGFILAGFVFGHMAGNLQFFLAPEWINTYAYHLQHMPYGLLWVVRSVLLGAVIVHGWTAITLYRLNRLARPVTYAKDATVQASQASRTMIMSGLVIMAFIVFHILHYTVKNVYDYSDLHFMLDGKEVHNVYAMMYLGFAQWYVSLFYIIAVFLLCSHLSHGISSMFQSLGLRNEVWRYRLDFIAKAYGIIVFIGFAVIPVAVLLDVFGIISIFDTSTFQTQLDLVTKSCCPFAS